ncbi:MAG: hypothetical protein OZ917_07540 [Candidatus Brocadiaceae bacterium]|nr:hypothetical protein [Candidatus Brocadiaceae bacterium]
MQNLFLTMIIWLISLLTMNYVHAQQEQEFLLTNVSDNPVMPEPYKSKEPPCRVSLHKYEYAAQFIYGIQKEHENMRLARGCYITSITVHNPNDADVRFFINLVLTHPSDGQNTGKVMPMGESVLKAGEAVEITGEDVQKELFPNGFPSSYIKGLFIIRSTESLDVAALYETATIDPENNIEALNDIDIKQICGREIQQKPLPDLVIRHFDASQLYSDCYDWPETCVTRVTFTVENIGNKAAGSFNIRVVFDPAQSVVVNQAVLGLDAGASQTFTIKTPPGRSCFDPDCTVCVKVDSENTVTESDEENNYLCVNKSEKNDPEGK